MENIGLQLYSIKELTSVDFYGTLEKVANIGYNGVEFAGYFGSTAKELKKVLAYNGLKAAGSHMSISTLIDHLDQVIEYSQEINDPYIICPYLPEEMRNSYDAYMKTSELFNRIGEKCKESGIQFAYHNHEFEFFKFNGEHGLDILFNNTQPDNLHIELDTFWVEYSDLRSIDFINKYKERCSVLHIKELKSLDDKISTVIGKGIMDFKEISTLGKKNQVQWYTIEQEEFDMDQLQSVKEGFEYLKSIL